jgi:uncharacterized small protein (DUF1192 family)
VFLGLTSWGALADLSANELNERIAALVDWDW